MAFFYGHDMNKNDLGRRMYLRSIVLCGRLSKGRWHEFLLAATTALGMNPAGEAATWTYPANGKGGNGQTIVQPITESFLALDTWPDHKGAYFLICSCKSPDLKRLGEVYQEFGVCVWLESASDLGFPDE